MSPACTHARDRRAAPRALARACRVWVVCALFAACDRRPEHYQPEFTDAPRDAGGGAWVVGVHPLHNPERLFAVYQPLVAYLEAHLPGRRFRLEASKSYADFETKLLEQRAFHFALPNPYQTVRALHRGYRVFGKMGDDDTFRGIILVRKDSGITEIADLRGKAISYPAPTALAATMMPQYFLFQHGLDVNRDVQNLYVGSQESSITAVRRGFVAAGATWPVPWRAYQREHPDDAAELEVRWQTETLPNNGLVAREDVPPALVAEVASLLFALPATDEGRRLLERIPIAAFEPATDATYDVVRAYVERFSREVRPVEVD